MASFSIADAAFSGFRIMRQKPKAFGVWLLVSIIISVGLSTMMMRALLPAMAQMQQFGHQARPDPTQAMAAIQSIMPIYGLALLFSLIFYPVVYAAMDRAVLRPTEDAFGYLRLGADELRQGGVMLLYGAVMLGVYIVTLIAAVIVGGGVGAALALSAKGNPAAGAFAGLVMFVVMLAIFSGLIYCAARFCLASPLTFDKARVDLFGSWTLTKGRFWPIFATAILVFFVTMGVELASGVIMAAMWVIPGLGGNLLQAYVRPDLIGTMNPLSPGMILSQVVMGATYSVLVPLWLTPPAAIYRSLTGGTAAPAVAEVFT